MNRIIVRFVEKIDDLRYWVVVIAHSIDVNVAYKNDEPIIVELYYDYLNSVQLNIPYELIVLNESPFRAKINRQIESEVDMILIKRIQN